ncbi:MFS transporter [Rickettsiales bacterium]|nr:MFS transporter [Rickettsiales bacterium]
MELSRKNLILYSTLAFCLAFIGLPMYIYLPSFYHDNFSIKLETIAFIILFTRLIDTIQDPIFGVLSDKYYKFKKKIICYLSPLLGLSFFLLFNPPEFVNVEIWLVITLITTYSLFSAIYINYHSYAVSLTDNYNEKTRIISYREIFFISGIIFSASVPSILFTIFDEKYSFFIMGLVYGILIIIFAKIFWNIMPNIVKQEKMILNLSFINRDLKHFFLIFLFNSIASSIPAVLILFFVEDILNAKNLAGLFLVVYFLGLLIGTILWTKISKLINDKVQSWIMAMIITVISFSFCITLQSGDIFLYILICLFCGIGFGADFCLGYSILTDIIQKYKIDNYKTTIFGVVNFIIKISLTISSFILIYLIGKFEYNLALKKDLIKISYCVLPIIFRILSIIITIRTLKKNLTKK